MPYKNKGTMTKFKLSKSDLLTRLQVVSKIISTKPSLPIMSSILFELEKEKLFLTATDHSGQINTVIDSVQSEDSLSFCLDSKLLIDALKTLPEQPIVFEVNEENLNTTIKYHGGKFEMVALPLEDVMQLKEVSNSTEVKIPLDVFLNGITKTITCSAEDELRPIMTSVFIEIKEGQINHVASDGKKLALLEHKDDSLTETISFVLPKKIASILKSIFPASGKEDLKLSIASNRVKFEYESYSIVSTLLEGRFPNYKSVIPTNNDKEVKISTATLKSALSRILVFSNQASRLVTFNLNTDSLTITVQDIDYSTCADEKIECEYSGPSFKIGLNGNSLIELLASMNGEDLIITFSDPMRAALLYPANNSDSDRTTCLLMPMMLND